VPTEGRRESAPPALKLASYLRIEERELQAGYLNWTAMEPEGRRFRS
jgi:hypothetical protein